MNDAMRSVKKQEGIFSNINWQQVIHAMHERGYALVPRVMPPEYCHEFIKNYDNFNIRKTVVMERHRFGFGEYKYFDYPLPDFVQIVRQEVYPHLAPIANIWAERLNLGMTFPTTFDGLQNLCRKHGQMKPTPLILKYGKGGYNTLHQDLYGEIYFPMQAAFFLNEPGKDYTGGEFVLTEQVPRAQSKAIVLHPGRGDMMIFTTNFRPVKGTRGYYRAAMRHSVSEVLSGERHTLGVIFHDAVS